MTQHDAKQLQRNPPFCISFFASSMRKRRGNCHGHLLGLLGFPLGLPAKAPRSATEADESTPTPVGEVEEAVGHIVAGQSFLDSLPSPFPVFGCPVWLMMCWSHQAQPHYCWAIIKSPKKVMVRSANPKRKPTSLQMLPRFATGLPLSGSDDVVVYQLLPGSRILKMESTTVPRGLEEERFQARHFQGDEGHGVGTDSRPIWLHATVPFDSIIGLSQFIMM